MLVSADYSGLVVATDLTTKTMLWSKQIDGQVYTLRIHNNAVLVPVFKKPMLMLQLTTGDLLRQLPVLAGETRGIDVFLGTVAYIQVFRDRPR